MIKVSSAASADIFENSFGLQTEDLHPLRQTYAANLQKTIRLPYHINSSKSRQLQQRADAYHSEKLSWQSLEAARQSLICDPGNTRARKTLACSLQDIGCGEDALDQYRMALGEEKRRKSLTTQSSTTRFVNEKGFGVLDMMNNNHELRQTIMGDAPPSQALVKRLNGLRSLKPVNYGKPASKLLRIAVSILLFMAFTPFLHAQQGGITISGQVSSYPHPVHPHTTILAKDPDTQETLAQTQTDENGYYSLEIVTTHTNHVTAGDPHFFLSPNPFGRHATLAAWLPSAGNYTLAAYDMVGRMILKETLPAQPGLNLIPVKLPPAEGLVIITLQGEHFRKTLKALQNNEQGQYDRYNHGINKRLNNTTETLQDRASTRQIDSGDVFYYADDQGCTGSLGHDRSAGFDCQHTGVGQGMQGSEMYGSETQQYLTILFSSDNHEGKDTTVTFMNHEINKVLNQIPETVNSSYDLYVFDDLGSVEGASINVYNVGNTRMNNQRTSNRRGTAQRNNNDLLFSGTTNDQGVFSQNYEVQEWTWPGQPTIRNVQNLLTTIGSDAHEPYERVDAYQQNLDIQAELERLTGTQTANIDITLKNHPMNNLLANANYSLINEHGETIGPSGTSNQNGKIIESVTRGYEVIGQDTIFSYNQIIIPLNKTHHENDTITKNFEDIQKIFTMTQTQYEGNATLNIQLTSQPFEYGPNNVNLNLSANNNNIGNTTTSEGSATIENILYQYYQDENEVLKKINGEEVTELSLEATHTSHENTTYTISFQDEMNIEENINQVAHEKTAQITGTVKNQNQEPVNAASAKIKNYDNNEEIHTTQTNNQGIFEHTQPYTEYTNPDNAEGNTKLINGEPIAQIYAKITKPNHEETTTNPKTLDEIINFGEITLPEHVATQHLNFTFKPITVNGDMQVSTNVINVRLGDVVQSYTVGTQQEINVNITAETNDTYVTIWDEPPVNEDNEPLYNEVIIIHTQNREWYEEPEDNNNQTVWRTKADQQYDSLKTNISILHNRHDLELIKMYNYFDHPSTNVGRIYTNGVRGANFITGRSGYLIASHVPTDEGDGWQILFKTYDQANPDNNVPQSFIDNWTNAINQVMNASTRNDGQKTFDWKDGIHYVNSPDDPKYIEAQNNNWLNTLRITPQSDISMAVNTVSGGYPHHMWGRARSPPWETSVAVALEEIIEPTYRFTDPDLSSVAYILEWVDGTPITQLNDFAKRAIRYRQQLGHMTKFNHVVDD